MSLLTRLLLAVLLIVTASAFAQKTIAITSPDAQIKFWLSTDSNGLFYKIAYKGVLMADKSRLNISFKEGGAFNNKLAVIAASPKKLTEDYELITGKTSKVHSECNQVIIPVTEQTGSKRRLEVESARV